MNRIRTPKDVISFLCVLALGIVPLCLFFLWVERHCTLPWVPQWLGLPWIFVDGHFVYLALWDLGMLVGAALLQWGLGWGKVGVPVRLVAGGMSALLIMSFWQTTGVPLYQLVPHAPLATFLSLTIFWGCLGVMFKLALRWVGPPGFFDVRCDRSIYFLTVAAFVVSPMMTLDRIFVASLALFFPLFLRGSFTLNR